MVFFILAIDYFDNGDFHYKRSLGSNYQQFETAEFAAHYAKTFYSKCEYKVFRVELV